MNISTLNEWLTLLTSLAVIAGIVFLAIELRQNSVALRSNVLQSVTSELDPLNLALASDESMRTVWIKGLQHPTNLTESERLQFNVIMHVWVTSAQNWYLQEKSGVLSPEIADGQWVTMNIFNNTYPGFRDYWDTRGYVYTPGFRQFIERKVFARNSDQTDVA